VSTCTWIYCRTTRSRSAGGGEINLEINLLAGEERADYEPYSRTRHTSAAESAL